MKIIDKQTAEYAEEPVIFYVAGFDLVDIGKLDYIFQASYPETRFFKFFAAPVDYEVCDYIIVLNHSPGKGDRPDFSFLENSAAYQKYIDIHYSQGRRFTEVKLKEMYDYFSQFPVISKYASQKLCFYLCKNPFKKPPAEEN